MNLKRIIKEELDGLEWIKDVKPTLNDAFEQGTLKKGDVLTLSGELADCDAITTKEVNDFKIKITKLKKKINNSYFIPLQKKYWEHLEYNGKGDTRFYTSDGKMKIEDHHNELMESNDLQWIRDIKPIPELKVGTCFIDVMDSTQTEWIIIDFKMTPGGTPIVVIKNKKNNTDIRYKHEGYFEEDLLSHRYKPCSNKLMESNDFQWIRDIKPIPNEILNIDKYPPGDYKIWLGDIPKEQQLLIIDYIIDVIESRDDLSTSSSLYSIRDTVRNGEAYFNSLYFDIYPPGKMNKSKTIVVAMMARYPQEGLDKYHALEYCRKYFDRHGDTELSTAKIKE